MKVLGRLCITFVVVFYKAYVLMLAWGWFVVPLGVSAITYVHAMGLITLKGLAWFKGDSRSVEEEEENWQLFYTAAGLAWGHLLLFTISRFM